MSLVRERSQVGVSLQAIETQRPLLIGTSGGAGCNVAIEAIAHTLREAGVVLPEHTPRLLKDEKYDSFGRALLTASFFMNDIPGISASIAAATGLTNYPVIPDRKTLRREMIAINKGQLNVAGQPKKRCYIDMLLDVYGDGYLFVAIYNILIRRTKPKQSKNMVDQQTAFEGRYYQTVKQFIFNQLNVARIAGTPYTEIITTQMISLDAICSAVIEYNNMHSATVAVYQYMSDIMTSGAQHYIHALSRLHTIERSILHLRGINLNDSSLALLDNTNRPFASIQEISLHKNPMIRPAFNNTPLQDSLSIDQVVVKIQRSDAADYEIVIQSHEKIASVMLSSVGGDDTVDCAGLLAQLTQGQQCQYEKIFVFCGANTALKKRLQQLNLQLTWRAIFLGLRELSSIIILDHQDDVRVASILTRSDLTILHGGMVITEEMALKHHKDQRFFFHHSKDDHGKLTTGLPWEDASIDYFIDHVRSQHGIAWAKKGTIDMLCAELSGQSPRASIRLLDELSRYIARCEQSSSDGTLAMQQLNQSMCKLLQILQKDIDSQITRGVSENKICRHVSYKLANKTMQFIGKFHYLLAQQVSMNESNNQHLVLKAQMLELAKEYDEDCYQLAHGSRFSKSIVLVLVAAVGVALGMVIGGGVGMIAGAWTGPGAVVSAIAGLVSGAYTGAALGLTISATLTGVATAAVAANRASFFHAKPMECAARATQSEISKYRLQG